MKFFASCAKGLEYLLADELIALGAAKATAAVAGVNVEGELIDAQRAVLWSRLASRVLWPLTDFDCPDEHALYAGAAAVDWKRHLSSDMTLAVDAHVSGTAITHARYAAQRTKDAVVDTLRTASGERPSVDVESPDLRLSLVVRKGRAIVSVDLGGGPLHRRGWRQAQGEAPLKETLATAVLMRGDWPRIHGEGGGLLDPMCGSGTLLIEGAMMAADVAPGLLRHSDRLPSRWLGFDVSTWRSLVEEARQREAAGRAGLREVFFGSDSDPHAIHAAKQNAVAAGIPDVVRWELASIEKLQSPIATSRHPREGGDPATFAVDDGVETKSLDFRLRGNDGLKTPAKADADAGESRGLVVCNPPYDARLAADPALYRALGDALKRTVPAWRASLLCGDPELAYATGLRAQKKYQVFNGALECALIVCDPIAFPARESAAPKALSEGAQMVANRLRKNLKKLKSWREREGVACYRVYDADLPEYSAAIDVYTEADDPDKRWLHVQEYAAPAEIPEADVRRRLRELLDAAQDAFALPRERIALKTRERGKGGSKYGRLDQRGEWIVVREGQARLRVNLFDYLDTGLFLDHRPLRQRIAEEAEDARFLNLFGYTGAATVQAAVGRARQTTTVDLSATYLQWCSDNLRENGFGGAKHRLVQADAIAWLGADQGQYDLIFCDPPTFSNSARADDFDLQREHVRLLHAAMARLAPGGALYFSNNSRRFRLDAEAVAAFADYADITAQTIPPDFARNQRIHQAWRLTAR